MPVFAQTTNTANDTIILSLSRDSINRVFFKKQWRFSPNDSADMAKPDYNDNGWKLIYPEDIDSSELNGIGWFRLSFTIDSSWLNKPLAFSLTQKGASEIYLDGKKIKSYGKINGKDSTESYNPQRTPFVVTMNSVGKHVLAIRYARFHFEDESNDFGFNLEVGIADEVIVSSKLNDIVTTITLTVLAIFFLSLGFLHLLFYLFYRQNASNLWFSVFMAAIAGIWSSIIGVVYVNDPNLGYRFADAIFIFSNIACVTFPIFIHVLFNIKKKIWVIIPLVLFAGSVLSWSTTIYENDTFMVVLVIYASVYSLIGLLRAIIKKVKGAIFLGIGFGFFLVSLISITVLGAVAGSIEVSSANSTLAQVLGIVILLDIVSIPITMSVYQAWIFARLNKDLSAQLRAVKELSDITIKQEQEKKQILESQNVALERMVEERTSQLSAEKLKSDNLLLNILPEEVANELKQDGQSAARQYNHVTVLFTDFVNFTGLSEQMSPKELVAEIHRNFTAFDAIIEKYGLEKIKTIGDAYLAVCGMPNETTDHAQRVVKAAIEITDYMTQNNGKFQIRIGIHSGPVVAGIVGVKKYAYDIWGDTVNTAARMESNSEEGKINISQATYELVKNEFTCEYRGKINAKNKGEVDMYFVNV
ncbi:MAG: hypothetical protein EAY81_08315 [Bacteroidetes bacterium]|nr:MAG: hypothetical protein EAY81_08315 [Bacteroidota bacterium]